MPNHRNADCRRCSYPAMHPRESPTKSFEGSAFEKRFFSRSHSSQTAEFIFGKDYIWFKRWPEFFRRRLAISSTHNWVVTTDISTFFDNVHYGHLRNIISTLDGIEEVVLDILFDVVDEISWRPDYLPSVGIGLPQVQFDAPRLLAHIYLYEIDQFLKKETADSFVRWVDDITFAVDSHVEGKTILRDLDALLQLRGVRLNSGKTSVLSKLDARRFFHGRANEFLDRMKSRIDDKQKLGFSTNSLSKRLRSSFDSFVAQPAYGHHDKVCKRYVGLFGKIGDNYAIDFCTDALITQPGFRDTVYRYALDIGPQTKLYSAFISYVKSPHALDDASICQIALVLTLWRISPKSSRFRALAKLGVDLGDPQFTSKSHYYFVASLWLVAKYGTQKNLREVLEKNETLWSNSEFLSRQVAASAGKFRNERSFKWIALKIERHGFRSAVSVINSLRELQEYENNIPGHIRLYCTNGNNVGKYSIQRFLISFRVLTSKKLKPSVKQNLKSQIIRFVNDPHYARVLNSL